MNAMAEIRTALTAEDFTLAPEPAFEWRVSAAGHHLETPDGFVAEIVPFGGENFIWRLTTPAGEQRKDFALDWPMARAVVEFVIEELR